MARNSALLSKIYCQDLVLINNINLRGNEKDINLACIKSMKILVQGYNQVGFNSRMLAYFYFIINGQQQKQVAYQRRLLTKKIRCPNIESL